MQNLVQFETETRWVGNPYKQTVRATVSPRKPNSHFTYNGHTFFGTFDRCNPIMSLETTVRELIANVGENMIGMGRTQKTVHNERFQFITISAMYWIAKDETAFREALAPHGRCLGTVRGGAVNMFSSNLELPECTLILPRSITIESNSVLFGVAS